jgi:hypothetical protein
MLVGVTTAGCGAKSALTFCNEFQVIACARVFECYDATVRASAQFVATYGGSQSECESKLKSQYCATITDSHPCTDSSQKYNAGKADACEGDLKAASCATITGGTFSSGNCNAVCT